MAPCALPRHPRTHLYAIGLTRSGRPVWPVMGGEESPEAAAQAAAAAKANADKAAADKAAADKAAADATAAQRGFPDHTAVADMTEAQQAAYWKHYARKHEERASALGNLSAADIAALQAKAKIADDLEAAKGTDTEKAIRSAHEAAEQAANERYQPLLVTAKFEAIVAGRIPADKLATILTPLDKKHFLAADGTVDTAKVTAYVEGILPAKGNQERRGPSSAGSGPRGSTPGTGTGRDLHAQRHPDRAGAKTT